MDETHAYWTTVSGRIERGSFETGAVDTLTTVTGSSVLALAGDALYFADGKRLARMPKAGGTVEVLASATWSPVDLVVDGKTVLVLDYGSGVLSGRVLLVSPGGGLAPIIEQLDFPRAIALRAPLVYVVAEHAMVSGQFVAGAVVRASLLMQPPVLIASEMRESFGIAADPGKTGRIYVGRAANAKLEIDGRLFIVDQAMSTSIPVVGDALALGMARDGDVFYVTVPGTTIGGTTKPSRLMRVPLSGQPVTTVVEKTGPFFTFPAVNAKYIAITQQHYPPEAPLDANVRVLCKP